MIARLGGGPSSGMRLQKSGNWRLFQIMSPMLHDWDNFYVTTGAASASLIGLLFVVVTLGAGLSSSDAITGARAFLTSDAGSFRQRAAALLGGACAVRIAVTHGGDSLPVRFERPRLSDQGHRSATQDRIRRVELGRLDSLRRRSGAGQCVSDRRRGRTDRLEILRPQRHRRRDDAVLDLRPLRRLGPHVVDRRQRAQAVEQVVFRSMRLLAMTTKRRDMIASFGIGSGLGSVPP